MDIVGTLPLRAVLSTKIYVNHLTLIHLQKKKNKPLRLPLQSLVTMRILSIVTRKSRNTNKKELDFPQVFSISLQYFYKTVSISSLNIYIHI